MDQDSKQQLLQHVDQLQPSLLTTEPTAALGHTLGQSAENLAEGSLFEKGLIETGRTMHENSSMPQNRRQSLGGGGGLEEDMSASNVRVSAQQDNMHSTEGEGTHWSPNDEDGRNNSQGGNGGMVQYYSTQNTGVEGIIGKLGRLEAMILSQGNQNSKKKGKEQSAQKMPYPLKQTTIDRIIYPVYTKKGLKYGKPKKKKEPSQMQLQQQAFQEPIGKLLDGFLILYSCRVKLPHEAIKSKLASQRIVEVIEEDLCYFQNLNAIDLSDNKVRLEQLKNLKSLVDINLQYNNIQLIPPLVKEDFPKLEVLNLSYNQLTPASIRYLYNIPRLKTLDLQGNNLVTLPEDMKELKYLEELNLSSNLLSTASTLINPAILMKVIGQIPRLKRLNLSRNKLQGLHYELLNREDDYSLLQELDLGYNLVQEEDDVWYACQMKNLQILIITGNPFALAGKQAYERLEEAMQKNLSATVINEDVPEQRSYLKKPKNQKQLASFPYPNPIKLFSRDMNSKEIKGEYLNAELMNQGVALQISEIRPDTNIEQEIFPRELTRDAQEKEIFTPPNHKQMRFNKSGGPRQVKQSDGSSSAASMNQDPGQFFITENILADQPAHGDSKIIQEERSQQESEIEKVPQDDSDQEDEEEEQEDENFDFGRAKMDYFKQRAKDILMGESDLEYDGNAMQMAMCFKNLKNAIRNPIVVHAGSEQKPHYLKMTFSTCRQAINGDKYLELSKLIGSNGSLRPDATISGSKISNNTSKIPALMRAGKEMHSEESLMLLGSTLGGTIKKKTKKEEMIDKKIEYLLETYKKQDEELLKKADQKHSKKRQDRKKLRDKFGFSDEEDAENEEDDKPESRQSELTFTGKGRKSSSKGEMAQTAKFNNQVGGKQALPPVKQGSNKLVF